MKAIKVKTWFYEKMCEAARMYNTFIDVERDAEGIRIVRDDCVTVYADEFIAESEKAIKVTLRSGAVVGSYKGWTTWIPKSVVVA